MTISKQTLASLLRQLAALAAVVIGVVGSPTVASWLPASASTALVAVGGLVIAIEHYVADPSTGSTPPK